MDLFTASTTLSAVSLALSGALGALSIKSLIRARTAEQESNERTMNVATQLGGLLRISQSAQLAQKSHKIFELELLTDEYREKLIQSEENLVQAQCGLVGASIVNTLLQQKIAEQNTDLALLDEEFEEIEGFLRRIHPELPHDVSLAEAVETIFEAIVTSGYAETYGGQENEKGVVARVVQKLAEEAELLRGELDDTYMKHGHAVDVIRQRAGEIETLKGLVETQGEVIQELRDEKALAEQELVATKIVANDDSADADHYASILAKSDALAVKLLAELSRTSIGYTLTEDEQAALISVQLRHDVRTRRPAQPGAVGTEAQLAA